MKIEIELKFNGILSKEDVRPEIEAWLKKLNFRHLVDKKIIKILEE